MPLNATQASNLAIAATAAVACEKDTKLPAELTVPQWADESGWGEHEPGNNCFGIKAVSGADSETLSAVEYMRSTPLTENQSFETFPTLQACFDRHAQLITAAKPYAAAWAQFQKDGDKAMLSQRIAHSYATDPMYGTKLARIAQMPEVRAAIASARKPLVTIQPAASTPAAPAAAAATAK